MSNTLDHEPTLYDVMDILVTIDGRFNAVDARFDSLEDKINKGYIATHNRIDNLDERVIDLTQAVSKLSLQFAHLEDTVDDHTEYIEDNSTKMSKHDSRIKKLELKLFR